MSNIKILFSALLTAVGLFLVGCGGGSGSSGGSSADSPSAGNSGSGTDSSASPMTGGGPAQSRNFFDQTLTGFDGETIAFTVYIPDLAEGEAAPLLLHSHGFGLSRASNLENPDPVQAFLTNDVTGITARNMWLDEGYYVISFDQRGFGETSGNVTVMDPDIDCRNVSDIIDWAEANLTNLGTRDGDPVIGSVGLSYGGGFQTVCASMDERFDALIPVATWSHLPYSLYAGETPKNIWLDILVAAGGPTAQFQFEPYITQSFIDATTTGTVAPETLDILGSHSPASFCANNRVDGRGPSNTDAFFIQGVRDILFNFNEAADNFQCWRDNGNDARLLIQTDGHIVPVAQESGSQILFGVDETVNCGGEQLNVVQMMTEFLNEKLLGVPPQQRAPEICISQSAEHGMTLAEVPYGGVPTTLPRTDVVPGGASNIINLLQNLPLATVLELLVELPSEALTVLTNVLTGLADPTSIADSVSAIVNLLPPELLNQIVATGQFVPLQLVTQDSVLAGIPQAQFEVSGGNGESNLLFVGIGVQSPGGDARLINDQVLPVRGDGVMDLDLIGLSERVPAGSNVGLMVFGFHHYFLNVATLSQPPVPGQIAGTVSLPLVEE